MGDLWAPYDLMKRIPLLSILSDASVVDAPLDAAQGSPTDPKYSFNSICLNIFCLSNPLDDLSKHFYVAFSVLLYLRI
jgi:hypothetical protein